MILLETGNRIVAETIKSVIIPDPDFKPQPFEVKVADFDNASFFIHTSNEVDRITLSLQFPCYHQIESVGAKAALEKAYADYVVPEAESGYDVTISVTKDQWVGKEEAVIEQFSNLKRVVLGGVFEHFFSAVNSDSISTLKPFKFDLRPDTTIYFIPSADRVFVVFQLALIDKADQVIGKVFLTEFADPSIRRKAQRAPLVTFSQALPPELESFPGADATSANDVGYVSFTIQKLHCADAVRPKLVDGLQTFRNFVQYHLKCSKAYFHSRMRHRVAELTKVLNRAKINQDKGAHGKATISATGKLVVKR